MRSSSRDSNASKIGRQADGADRDAAEGAEGDRTLRSRRAPEVGESNALDQQGLDEIGREVGGDLPEQGTDEQS